MAEPPLLRSEEHPAPRDPNQPWGLLPPFWGSAPGDGAPHKPSMAKDRRAARGEPRPLPRVGSQLHLQQGCGGKPPCRTAKDPTAFTPPQLLCQPINKKSDDKPSCPQPAARGRHGDSCPPPAPHCAEDAESLLAPAIPD